jgi:predicted RNA binding protein YcfA (HicA-like mRNA interferase family)
VKPEKTLEKILSGSKSIRFDDMVSLAKAFGFVHDRTRGSHFIFNHPVVAELLNLQAVGGQVKPYQVRQFLKLVEEYDLKLS